MLIPHPPYLFGSEGEPVSSVRPEGLESWENKEGYVNEVKFANKNFSILKLQHVHYSRCKKGF